MIRAHERYVSFPTVMAGVVQCERSCSPCVGILCLLQVTAIHLWHTSYIIAERTGLLHHLHQGIARSGDKMVELALGIRVTAETKKSE